MNRCVTALCLAALAGFVPSRTVLRAQQANTTESFGLHTLQQAIVSAGFPCPIAQRVETELERTPGIPEFLHKVQCRHEGQLDVDPGLTYRVRREKGSGRLLVRPW
jgi:hypothetical protein